MIKRFIIALVFVAVVCGGLVGFNMFRAKAIQGFFASMKRPAVTISVADVVPITWQPAIDAFGTVAASQGTDVAVELGGVVKEIMFKANERVDAGQVLVQIRRRRRARRSLGRSVEPYHRQGGPGRAQSLWKRGVGTSVTAEVAQAAFNGLNPISPSCKPHSTLKAIEAPFAGTVGIARVDVGQYVQPARSS